MWDHMGGYGGWTGVGLLWMVLLWLIIALVIAALVKWLFFSPPTSGKVKGEKQAQDILDERYARGEIEREEYQRKKTDLQK